MVTDQRLYRFLNDYKLNLISTADMGEEDFKKCHTNLGFAMKVIKHQKEDADEVIKETNHRKIDRDQRSVARGGDPYFHAGE